MGRENVFLTELNLVRVTGKLGRRLEVVVSGLPYKRGAQIAVDTTLVSPLTREGVARPKAHWCDGAALEAAKRDKETKYPDVHSSPLAELVVLACEVGGRWNEQALETVRLLAKQKALNG